MKRARSKKLSSMMLVVGLAAGVSGVSGAAATPAFAGSHRAAAVTKVKKKTFTTTGTFTTTSIGSDGSFTATIDGSSTKSAALSSVTLSGVTTEGPKPVTTTKKKFSGLEMEAGVEDAFTVPVSTPWLVGTLSGTVSPPTGYGPPTSMKGVKIDCVCDWSGRSWSWTITLSWTSTSTA